MIGLGTIINCGSVLAGASAGMLLKNGLSKRFESIILSAVGLAVMFIGLGGAMSGLLTIKEGVISTQYTMLMVLSLVLGALLGEALDIERKHLQQHGIQEAELSAEHVNAIIDKICHHATALSVTAKDKYADQITQTTLNTIQKQINENVRRLMSL